MASTQLEPGEQNELDVLAVDDDSLIREVVMLAITMERPDVRVRTASRPSEVLARFGAIAPRVVVTDFDMPEMDGGRLIEKIRAAKPDQRIILFTGRSTEDVIALVPADVMIIEKSSANSVIDLRNQITAMLDARCDNEQFALVS